MRFEEYEHCMKVKCKNCTLDGQCKHLNKVLEERLTWRPFENLNEIILNKRGDIVGKEK